ncbi:MAG: bis(5'-nucleosyl)-tetraphosphatase (symmetrical) YqeK, partial [Anaerovorax sp.]
LSEKRRIHTYAVVKEARALADRWNVDLEKAQLAALCHDLFRGVALNISNTYVEKYSMGTHYLNNLNLTHGRMAAIFMEETYGIQDEDILNAVKYHTTGRAGMSHLEEILYLADAIEPNRSYPSVEEIRRLAYEDLDEACLFSMNHTIDYVTGKGSYLDENTLFARDSMREKIKRRKKGEIV